MWKIITALAWVGLAHGAALGGQSSAPDLNPILQQTSVPKNDLLKGQVNLSQITVPKNGTVPKEQVNSSSTDVGLFPDLFSLGNLWTGSIMDDIVDDLIGETFGDGESTFGDGDSTAPTAEQNKSVPHADVSQNEIEELSTAQATEETEEDSTVEDRGVILEHVGSPVEHVKGPMASSEDQHLHVTGNQTQRSNSPHMPIRYEDPDHARNAGGIAVGHPGGECPPPVPSSPPGLCRAPACASHMECYPHRMCCFNGCTYTCQAPIPPAPMFDWAEDTDTRMNLLDPANPALPLRFEEAPLSYGTGAGETVRLPGGCVLSGEEYAQLKTFMAADSIQDCECVDGEVACKVKAMQRPKGGL